MALSREEGLVLRTRDLGEADRIITLITRERGKLQTVARGARRARSRLLAVSQPFAHGNYQLFLNKRGLHTLSQGELVQPFRHLRENLTCLAYANYLAELTDLILPEEEPQESVFEIALEAFTLLERSEVRPGVVARWYELHVLNLVGFRPELEQCVGCGAQLNEKNVAGLVFSIAGGGVLCPECGARDSAAVALGGAAWQSMRYLLSSPAQRLASFRPGEPGLSLLERILTGYIEYRLERRLNALAFLQSVEGMPESMA